MLERSIAFHVCVRTRGTGLLARSSTQRCYDVVWFQNQCAVIEREKALRCLAGDKWIACRTVAEVELGSSTTQTAQPVTIQIPQRRTARDHENKGGRKSAGKQRGEVGFTAWISEQRKEPGNTDRAQIYKDTYSLICFQWFKVVLFIFN